MIVCGMYSPGWVMAQFTSPLPVSYKVGAQPVQCGDILSGSFVGARNDHNGYMQTSGFPYILKERPECSFMFTMGFPGYILINQRGTTRHGVVLCPDSSNITSFPLDGYSLSLQLPAGRYFINIEQGEDTTERDFAFQLLCSNNSLTSQLYQDIRSLAISTGTNTAVRGDFQQGRNHASHYKDMYWYGAYYPGVERDWYRPEPDTFYQFRLAEPQQVTIRNNGNTGHKAYLLDSTGSTQDVLDVQILRQEDYKQASSTIHLPAGTYYLAVEQASATTLEPYDFQISTACAPDMPHVIYRSTDYGSESFGLNLNGRAVTGTVNNFAAYGIWDYMDLFGGIALPLYAGTKQNNFLLSSDSGYVSMFVDINQDGDFDDAWEMLYENLQQASHALRPYGSGWRMEDRLTDGFSYSPPDSLLWRVGHKVLRMRVILASGLGEGGCARYPQVRRVLDVPVILDAGNPGEGVSWLRKQADGDRDWTSHIGGMPDGGVIAYSIHAMPGVPYQNVLPRSQVWLQGAPGQGKVIEEVPRHHDDRSWASALTRYRPDGSIAWAQQIEGTGAYGLNPTSYLVNGSTSDRMGNFYLYGWLHGGLNFRDDTVSYAGTYGNGMMGFLYRVSPSGVGTAWNVQNAGYKSSPITSVSVDSGGGLFVGGLVDHVPTSGRESIRLWTRGIVSSDSLYVRTRGEADAFVAHYSPAGRPIWGASIASFGAEKGPQVTVTPSGKVYVVGEGAGGVLVRTTRGDTAVIPTVPRQNYLLVLDTAGHILRSQILASDDWMRVTKLLVPPHSEDLILVGTFQNRLHWTNPPLTATGRIDGYLARMTTSGTVLWSRSLEGAFNDTLVDVKLGRDGNLIAAALLQSALPTVLGMGVPPEFTRLQTMVLRISLDSGKALSVAGPLYGKRARGILSVAETGDSTLYMSGYAGDSITVPGVGVLACEHQNRLGNPVFDGFVARLGRSWHGVDQPTALPPKLDEKAGMIVYPNPSPGRFSLKAPVLPSQEYELTLIDITGRLVYRKILPGDQLQKGVLVDAMLKPGLYTAQAGGMHCPFVIQ